MTKIYSKKSKQEQTELSFLLGTGIEQIIEIQRHSISNILTIVCGAIFEAYPHVSQKVVIYLLNYGNSFEILA